MKLGEEETPGVDFGDTKAKPEVVLSMDADTAHRFWAGELPMHVALSRGLIRAKGPVATILRIVPVVGSAKDIYAARIAGGGAAGRRRRTRPAAEPEAETPRRTRRSRSEAACGDPEPEAEAPAAEAEPDAQEPVGDEAA